ncbi:Rpn family recombination-promoting nuclease/putative transposase [Nocardia sp. NPDC020380]|uniref:Rpn family recombination-promoting nuclease/putative transposase n=1 Tax=Nocardia sp. NPDC020380 TaxID=3364309 RepID=UPI003793BB0C
MADSPSTPHDAFFRHVLARAADAASELRSVLPPALIARVDWDDLRLQPCNFVSQTLRSRFSDVLFATRLDGHDAFVYVLIEHQSKPDPMMPLRMLEYLVAIWNRYLDQHPNTRTLPAVIPLVVHASPHGRRWKYPTEFGELIDIDSATRTAMADFLPRFRFLLDDLTVVDLTALRQRKLTPAARIMLVLLKCAPGNPHLGGVLMLLLEDLRVMLAAPGGTADLESVVTYILTVSETSAVDLGPVIDRLGPSAQEATVTAAEQLRAEGRAQVLIEQLSLKFGSVPDQIVEKVHQGDPAELRMWTARILTASSSQEVFEP